MGMHTQTPFSLMLLSLLKFSFNDNYFLHSEGNHTNAKPKVSVVPAKNKTGKGFVDVSLLVV